MHAYVFDQEFTLNCRASPSKQWLKAAWPHSPSPSRRRLSLNGVLFGGFALGDLAALELLEEIWLDQQVAVPFAIGISLLIPELSRPFPITVAERAVLRPELAVLLLICIDALLLPLAVWLSFWLRLANPAPSQLSGCWFFGCYRGVADWSAVIRLHRAIQRPYALCRQQVPLLPC